MPPNMSGIPRSERLPDMAAELVRCKVGVIVAPELLEATVPQVSRVVIFWNPGNPPHAGGLKEAGIATVDVLAGGRCQSGVRRVEKAKPFTPLS